MNNEYAVGTQVTMQAVFRDIVTGNLVNPTTVECKVMQPNREVVVCTANNVSTGTFTATFTPSIIGGHSYKFQGTGNCQVADFDAFNATGLFE